MLRLTMRNFRHPMLQRFSLAIIVFTLLCAILNKYPTDLQFNNALRITEINSRMSVVNTIEENSQRPNESREQENNNDLRDEMEILDSQDSDDSSLSKDYPRIVILWTTWRSGSTFLGELMASAVPNTFYSYEPLHPYGVKIFRSNNTATAAALSFLGDLFRCKLQKYRWTLRKLAREDCYRKRNIYLMNFCQWSKVRCGYPDVVNDACRSAQFHVAKVLRVGLVWARKLLQDTSLDHLQIIYMVRDPRPVIQSRIQLDWCKERADCSSVTRVCNHFLLDLQESESLQKDYPERFKYVQYEHLSLRPEDTVREIWKFLNLTLSKESLERVRKLTKDDGRTGPYKTSRDTINHTFSWRKSMSFILVQKMQDSCREVLQHLGLRSFDSRDKLLDFNISAFLDND